MTVIGAVDIGGTKIAVGIVDDGGRLLTRAEAASREAEAYGDGVMLITRTNCRENLQSVDDQPSLLNGMSIRNNMRPLPFDAPV